MIRCLIEFVCIPKLGGEELRPYGQTKTQTNLGRAAALSYQYKQKTISADGKILCCRFFKFRRNPDETWVQWHRRNLQWLRKLCDSSCKIMVGMVLIKWLRKLHRVSTDVRKVSEDKHVDYVKHRSCIREDAIIRARKKERTKAQQL